MTADGASGVMVGAGIKLGLFAALVSILAVLVGFTVVPLTPGKELKDAARRLAAGLLASFTLGPLLAASAFNVWPGYLDTWMRVGGDLPPLVALLAAAVPFIALSAIVGFWLVAALMRFFTKRANRDVLQMATEVRGALLSGQEASHVTD